MKSWWVVIDKLETDMQHSDELSSKWESFVFPAMQWCRDITTRLVETDFESVPEDTKFKVGIFRKAIRHSYMCDMGADRLRKREHNTVSKRLAKVDKWHALLASSILPDAGRKEVEVTNTAQANRPKQIEDAYFSTRGWQHSCGAEFDKLGKEAEWLNTTHEGRMRGFLSFATFVELDGDWGKHNALWRGLTCVGAATPFTRRREKVLL